MSQVMTRARAILMSPGTEWPLLAARAETTPSLYLNYIVVLAALAAVTQFISATVIGTYVPVLGNFRVGLFAGLMQALMLFVVVLIAHYLSALIISWLAPKFGGVSDRVQALKTVAYAYTAAAASTVPALIPYIGNLFMLAGAVYAIYLIKLGLPHTMKCAPVSAGVYTATSLLGSFLVGLVLGPLLMFGMASTSMWGSGLADSGTFDTGSIGSRLEQWEQQLGVKTEQAESGSGTDPQAVPTPSTSTAAQTPTDNKLERWAQRIEKAGKRLEQTQTGSETIDSQAKAVGDMLGAVLGGAEGKVSALSLDRLKSFAPEALADWKRTALKGERNGAMGIQVASAKATYEKAPKQKLVLEITDTGTMKSLVGLAQGWLDLEQESESDDGYEKTFRSNGRLTHEKWNNKDGYGEYGVVVGDRFAVKVSGHASSVAELSALVASLDLAGLEALKGEGAQARKE